MIGELLELDSEFSRKLLDSLRNRIIERRNVKMATLMAYLQDCRFLDVTVNLHMSYATKNDIAVLAKDLYVRLYPEPQADNNDEPRNPEPTDLDPPPPKRPFAKKLHNQLKENKIKRAQSKAAVSSTALFQIWKDMESYEATGKRPENLQQIHDALSSVPPTSAEERLRLLL